VFVETNFVGVDDQKRRVLIERLHQASGRLVDIGTVDHAVAEARNVVRLCSVHGCQHRSAAVMEFVCGACESLDPYTTHLTPHRLDELYSMIDGSFVGLGVEVRGDGRGLKIVSVLPDSPASVAGLDEGTSILAVDGVDLAGLNTEDAANRLQGPVGSVVRLRVAGADERARELAVTRREVIVHSVRDARLLEGSPGVGYVRIESFQKNTREELASLVSDLERSGARSLVIDLRGNPGGLLDVSLEAANLFVDHGVLVSTRGRAWGQNWEHRARSLPIHHLPIAVLVDSESASASEIFAAAIQDHHRGRVVGTRTYGKGSVQSILPLTLAGTGLRLTTAHFFSPKGKRLQGVGVEPDLSVVRGEDEMGQELPVPRVPTLENDPQLRLAAEQIGQTLAVRSAN
jgi:carboxyl-terminal processing protease